MAWGEAPWLKSLRPDRGRLRQTQHARSAIRGPEIHTSRPWSNLRPSLCLLPWRVQAHLLRMDRELRGQGGWAPPFKQPLTVHQTRTAPSVWTLPLLASSAFSSCGGRISLPSTHRPLDPIRSHGFAHAKVLREARALVDKVENARARRTMPARKRKAVKRGGPGSHQPRRKRASTGKRASTAVLLRGGQKARVRKKKCCKKKRPPTKARARPC